MPRRNPRNQTAHALRALADELEAGTRELSPTLVKALDRELHGEGEFDSDLSPEELHKVWAKEIDRRLDAYEAGKTGTVKLGALIDEIRKQLP